MGCIYHGSRKHMAIGEIQTTDFCDSLGDAWCQPTEGLMLATTSILRCNMMGNLKFRLNDDAAASFELERCVETGLLYAVSARLFHMIMRYYFERRGESERARKSFASSKLFFELMKSFHFFAAVVGLSKRFNFLFFGKAGEEKNCCWCLAIGLWARTIHSVSDIMPSDRELRRCGARVK